MAGSRGGLRFLHLSDIHFLSGRAELLGRNGDMRGRMGDDISNSWGHVPFDGILVTGDATFAGKPNQFDVAHDWLALIGRSIATDVILVVPGNHDVDRDAHRANAGLRAVIKSLRAARPDNVDRFLREFLTDEPGPGHILCPLDAYNQFADCYGCRISTDRPVWHRDFDLDGAVVRVHGLNSAIISDAQEVRGNLVLGEFQALLPEYDQEAFHISLCHHPPDWMIDHDIVDPALVSRVAIQLFGHKHQWRMLRIDESLRIVAGAVFPEDDGSNWLPTYGVIELRRGGDSITARITQHVWNPDQHTFFKFPSKAGADFREETLPLSTRAIVRHTSSRLATVTVEPSDTNPPALTELVRQLPEPAQIRLLAKVSLLKPTDAALGKRAIVAILARGDQDLEILRDEIVRLHRELVAE